MKRVRAREVERRRIKKELWSMDSSRGSPPRQLIVYLPFPLLVQTSSPLSIAIFSRALSAEFPFTSNRFHTLGKCEAERTFHAPCPLSSNQLRLETFSPNDYTGVWKDGEQVLLLRARKRTP